MHYPVECSLKSNATFNIHNYINNTADSFKIRLFVCCYAIIIAICKMHPKFMVSLYRCSANMRYNLFYHLLSVQHEHTFMLNAVIV